MQMKGSEADAAMMKRTEEAYSQLKADFAQLAAKYMKLKQKEASRNSELDSQHANPTRITLLCGALTSYATYFKLHLLVHG